MPCRNPGSSRGPSDLQSDALATELSWLCAKTADAVDDHACTQLYNTILGPRGQGELGSGCCGLGA